MSRHSRYKIITSSVVLVVAQLLAGRLMAEPQAITIIYPKPDQTVAAVDSTFILGHLPESMLEQIKEIGLLVNGIATPVHPDGGFIAYVLLQPGDFVFQVEAFHKKDLAGKKRPTGQPLAFGSVIVKVLKPLRSLPMDTLQIAGEYAAPKGDLALSTGDRLEVGFHGTPGGIAWFSIPKVVDSVPMAEREPQIQPYWGEALFGAGAVPESLLVRGIYSGHYDIPCSVSTDAGRIIYHLASSRKGQAAVTGESDYKISLNSKQFPVTVRFVDSITTVRLEPSQGYFAIFQPKGVEALAVGAEGDWYRLQFSGVCHGWVEKKAVELLPQGILPPHSYVRSVRTFGFPDSVVIEFPLSGVHPFRVIEDDLRTLRVQLFGVTSNTDWIRYDFADTLIDIATWSQPDDGLYEFCIKLTQDLWGYDCYYRGNTFCLELRKPPADLETLRGKRIVLDPGHSKDPGATGPTAYTEAEANLALAKVVRDVLVAHGATVVLTRDDDRNLPLADRPVVAKANHADIFVSIHNNALPDGVNPFVNNGVSTYYYHPHSIDLARAVQQEMIKVTGLRDYGLYHGNLAVNRPTQYPAILVECAFIILPEQEALLKTDKYRRAVARGITDGIEAFLKGYGNGR
ncbi:MAG: N-acetylmuramoyl-L-alanine amidase [Candidatus Zixiibacteriota bacterium]